MPVVFTAVKNRPSKPATRRRWRDSDMVVAPVRATTRGDLGYPARPMKTCTILALLLCASAARAEDTFRELRWRSVGPYRGGRTKAAAGVPGKPGLFYVGAVNGGVWRTDDFGRTWTPIFDDQPTGSIGAIAVAPSNPEVIYAGSGEGLQRPDLSIGDGIYKSTDAGRTWTHLGLRDGQQIPQIAVDPKDPNRLFVAVLGHPYGANEERGIYRSLDGGQSFQRVLYRDADTGGADVIIDPTDPKIVYATLWESRQAPWENGEFTGPGSGLYKSADGGTTWKQVVKGLPDYEHDKLGASAWGSRLPGARASSPRSRPRTAGSSTARTTPARAGRGSATIPGSPSARTISPR